MLNYTDFFYLDKDHPIIQELGNNTNHVWELLPKIKTFLTSELGNSQQIKGNVSDGAYLSKHPIFIDEGTVVEPGAYIKGPAYIGKNVLIRTGSYVRSNSILLDNSLLGNSSEMKNSIMLPYAHAPHFNYVGDSILGSYANLGAGTKLSNLSVSSFKDKKSGNRPTIKIKVDQFEFDTKLEKLGGILGDYVQTGCNSVINPGCLIGRNTLIYPNISLKKGYYSPDKIIKLKQEIQIVNKI